MVVASPGAGPQLLMIVLSAHILCLSNSLPTFCSISFVGTYRAICLVRFAAIVVHVAELLDGIMRSF